MPNRSQIRVAVIGNDPTYAQVLDALPNTKIVWRDWTSPVFQDSAATTPATGTDPVGYWGDKSGNGYHATRASDTTRPTLTTAGGKRALNFDGANDYLGVSMSQSSGNWTWIFAIEPDDVPIAAQYLLDIATGRLIFTWGTGSGGGNLMSLYDGSWHDNSEAQISGVQILTFELIAGTGTAKMYRNGIQIGSAFDYAAKALGGSQALGAFNNGAGTWFDGRIIFELGLSGALSASDFANVHNTLKSELGLA